MPVAGADASMIALRAGPYTARIAPAAGGRIAALACNDARGGHPLLVEWDGEPFAPHAWPKAGAFPMLPFANRLPAGSFFFGGREVSPEAGPGGVVQHGFAHRRPWEVVTASSSEALLRQVHEGDAQWPWPWTAEQRIRLGESGLSLTLRVRSDAEEPMPLAMGWHPYHPAPPELAPNDLHLRALARRDLGPTGSTLPVEGPPAFGLAPGETAAFRGWAGGAQLRAESGGAIVVAARGAPHLVLHRNVDRSYLCIEPVTMLPGHLFDAQLRPADGVLLPGAVRELSWSCAFHP